MKIKFIKCIKLICLNKCTNVFKDFIESVEYLKSIKVIFF